MSGMNIATLENAFMAWVKANIPSPWVAVFAEQNAPKPGPQQVTIGRGSPFITKIGMDVAGPVDTGTGARSKLGTRELAFSIRGFGAGATQVIEDLRTVLDDEMTDNTLMVSSLCGIDSGPVLDLAAIYGSQYKEVANVDVRLRTHSLREGADAEAGVGYITTVDLEIESVDQAGDSDTESVEIGPVP